MSRTPDEVRVLLARAEHAEHRAARLAHLAASPDRRPPYPDTPGCVEAMDDQWQEAVEDAMPPFAQAQLAIWCVLEAQAARKLASQLNRSITTKENR